MEESNKIKIKEIEYEVLSKSFIEVLQKGCKLDVNHIALNQDDWLGLYKVGERRFLVENVSGGDFVVEIKPKFDSENLLVETTDPSEIIILDEETGEEMDVWKGDNITGSIIENQSIPAIHVDVDGLIAEPIKIRHAFYVQDPNNYYRGSDFDLEVYQFDTIDNLTILDLYTTVWVGLNQSKRCPVAQYVAWKA